MSIDFQRLQNASRDELISEADPLNVADPNLLHHHDLVYAVARAIADQNGTLLGRGVLEVHGEGFGFLRSPADNFLPGTDDIYVSQSQIRRFGLQTGDTVIGVVRPPKEGERYLALLRVEWVNGEPTGVEVSTFESLTAIYPDDRIPILDNAYLRGIDMVAPIGLGQRGMLVAGPRSGRVELMRQLTDAVSGDDDLLVTVLLLGERPEEIHEWQKNATVEVIATPFDEPPGRHVQVADIVFARARRMVERGDDVVLLVDSLSRLLRFCHAELPASGRELQGVDVTALHRIRRYLGAARALEEGGSLTVIGVISGTDSQIDRMLLDDLRDVVNWELTLSKDIAERGIRPAVDVARSGTRREERLLTEEEQEQRKRWRNSLTGDPIEDATALQSLVANPVLLDKVAQSGQ
jgi:transcription termination factor Rho